MLDQPQTPDSPQSTPPPETPDSTQPPSQAEGSETQAPETPVEPQGPSPAELAEQARVENARLAYTLRRQKEQLDEREERLKSEASRISAAEAKERELKELLDADELTMLEKLAERRGRSVDDVLRRAIARITNNGELTPEQRESDVIKRVELAEKKHAELLERIEAREQREAEMAAAAEFNSFLADYRGAAINAIDERTYPVLSAYEPDEVADSVLATANLVADRTGEIPEVSQVLAYLERIEQAKLDRVAGKAGYTKAAPPPPPAAPAPAKRDPTGRFLPAALPNQVAAERGTAPADYTRMSDRDRLAEAGKFLAEHGIGTGR